MFLFESDNRFKLRIIKNLLIQKKLQEIFTDTEQYFAKVIFDFRENDMDIYFLKQSINLKYPIDLKSLISLIIEILSKFEIKNNDAIYYPMKNKITNKKNSTILGELHNVILTNLFLYKKNGIEKEHLYFKLWPSDKNYQINKLDTHLTNLKNHLLEKVGLIINITTVKGVLKLSFN